MPQVRILSLRPNFGESQSRPLLSPNKSGFFIENIRDEKNVKRVYFKLNTISRREIVQKSFAFTATVFGGVTFFFDKLGTILLICLIAFIISSLMEYCNQKNAGIIDEVVDKSITGNNTQFVLKKTYGIYNTDHYVYVYNFEGRNRYLFAVGKLYKDPMNEHVAPLYLNPICFFEKDKNQIELHDEEISNIDYKKLYVSRWIIADE